MNIHNFWLEQSKLVKWHREPCLSFRKKKNNYVDWYSDGKLNIFYNCITKNLEQGLGKKTAIYFVNKKKQIKSYTYEEINKMVNRFSCIIKNELKHKKLSSSKIMIHASASVDSAVSMLSCAKLGIFFSVIFEDLASQAIIKRILLLKPDIFFSTHKEKTFFKKIKKKNNLKKKIKFLFFKNLKYLKPIKNTVYIKDKGFKSNKELFTLFTSGSTGTPKGVVHSTGGYFVYTKYTCKYQFGMNKNSVMLTASDAGWINGHTYALFGPLSFGATTVLVESPMLLLDYNLLKKILKLKVTILYIPVTLIRLMKAIYKNLKFQTKYLSTLGSMGEPLAPSVAKWFSKNFTRKNNAIVNTYFQTETGGIIASPIYNQKTPQVPHGSVGKLVSKYLKIKTIFKNKKREIKILTPWPGCMKKIINGVKEWNKYWDRSNNFRMFDLATTNKQNIFIHGRIDDVINIRGHRIGSEEIESTALKIEEVHECCAISVRDDIEGHVIYLFVVSKNNNIDGKISDVIVSNFGTFALPKKIYYLSELPKTRSGKILRRLLRSILINPSSESHGDISTILNKKIILEIKEKIVSNGKN